MSMVKHQNLLPIHGSFVHSSKLYIIAPFLSGGSCLDIMKTAFPDGLEENAIATILKQGLLGLEYLHKDGLVHRYPHNFVNSCLSFNYSSKMSIILIIT